MRSMVDLSHDFLSPSLHAGAICVDATLGHGKDTLFFLKQGVNKVIGFEIQEDVLNETIHSIASHKLEAYCMGHERMDEVISKEVDAIVFNFGYCPGKDETITTQMETSLVAVQKALSFLKKKGRCALVFYPHEKGKREADSIEAYLSSLNPNEYSILKVDQLNRKNSPYFVGIEKK